MPFLTSRKFVKVYEVNCLQENRNVKNINSLCSTPLFPPSLWPLQFFRFPSSTFLSLLLSFCFKYFFDFKTYPGTPFFILPGCISPPTPLPPPPTHTLDCSVGIKVVLLCLLTKNKFQCKTSKISHCSDTNLSFSRGLALRIVRLRR